MKLTMLRLFPKREKVEKPPRPNTLVIDSEQGFDLEYIAEPQGRRWLFNGQWVYLMVRRYIKSGDGHKPSQVNELVNNLNLKAHLIPLARVLASGEKSPKEIARVLHLKTRTIRDQASQRPDVFISRNGNLALAQSIPKGELVPLELPKELGPLPDKLYRALFWREAEILFTLQNPLLEKFNLFATYLLIGILLFFIFLMYTSL